MSATTVSALFFAGELMLDSELNDLVSLDLFACEAFSDLRNDDISTFVVLPKELDR